MNVINTIRVLYETFKNLTRTTITTTVIVFVIFETNVCGRYKLFIASIHFADYQNI